MFSEDVSVRALSSALGGSRERLRTVEIDGFRAWPRLTGSSTTAEAPPWPCWLKSFWLKAYAALTLRSHFGSRVSEDAVVEV